MKPNGEESLHARNDLHVRYSESDRLAGSPRWPTYCHVSSTVRFWAFRIQCMIFAKACSIGLRSGEYGGRYQSLAPAALIMSRMACDLWEPRLSMMTMSPGTKTGTSCCSTLAFAGAGSGAEAPAVDRSVEDTRSAELVVAQRAEEGQRAPMTMRGVAAQALALRPPASQRGHIGLDPSLVDKDQPARIEAPLPGTPALPPASNICAGLLKREQRFF